MKYNGNGCTSGDFALLEPFENLMVASMTIALFVAAFVHFQLNKGAEFHYTVHPLAIPLSFYRSIQIEHSFGFTVHPGSPVHPG